MRDFWIAYRIRRVWGWVKAPFKRFNLRHPVFVWFLLLIFWLAVFAAGLWFTMYNLNFLHDTTPCQRSGSC